MVAIKAHEADRTLASLDRSIKIVLFYGPDQGLVKERASALCKASVSDPGDPFQLVRLDGNDLAADPLRLADEANTIGLFGGQRAIRISASSRSLTAAVEPLLAKPPLDAIVVIEAGDLPRNHALRVQLERAKTALAVPCFGDQARNLDSLVDPLLREFGLAIDRDARALLLTRLGADRQLSRREIEKLATYASGTGTITVADIHAIVGDASARDVDDVIDGVFTGAIRRVDQSFTRLTTAGEDVSVLLSAVTRHALALLSARQIVEHNNESISDAVAAMRGVPFTRRNDIEISLRRWTVAQLSRGIGLLHTATGQARRQPNLAREFATRALWNLTMTGPKANS